MDNYNYIKQFITNKLDDQPIPSIYNDVKKNCLDKLKLFEEEFTKKCIELKIETMDKLISGELEYQIEPHKYVENNPIVHLKTKELVDNLSKNEIKDINQHILQLNSIYLNYPDSTNTKLSEGEYVIFLLLQKKYDNYRECFCIIYITNYGRFIKSFKYRPFYNSNNYNICGNFHNVDRDNIIYYNINNGYPQQQSTNKITTQYYKPLEYKMPRLFLKIIESYDNQNTELLQECCKDYFTKFMESKKKDDKIKECEIIINKQKEELYKKDAEIEKLKKEIEELKKFYINS